MVSVEVATAISALILHLIAVLLICREMDMNVTFWMTGECSSWTCIIATFILGMDMPKVSESTIGYTVKPALLS